MRKLFKYLFLCCLLQAPAWAQEADLLLPESSGESVVLRSDRDIYGLSEQIHFFASYSAPEEQKVASWSTVLYVELISWNGMKQASSKVLIAYGGASGKIRIPKNIPSGVYYLRAYTHWMRNYSPISYTYLPLKILNPYNQEVLAGPQEGEADLQHLEHSAPDVMEGIVLSGLKDQYGTREQVEFEIQISEDLSPGSYGLGIAKTLGQSSADFNVEQKNETDKGSGKIEFLPEINGLTLSGKLVDNESNGPVSDARMQLSSYSNPFLFAEVRTAKDGKFLYALPHFTGNPEFHITEASDSLIANKILLVSEFCNKPVRLPYVPLVFDSIEQTVVKEILVNTQLKERYGVDAVQVDSNTNLSSAFYGIGASVTYVSDYIELANLREFIYEIIPLVSINNNSNGSFVNIQGPSCMDIYPPLVLIDNVPVPNNEELLNIPSNRIERIEALNQAYMIGNTRYSGILSIYSAKKDMSGLTQEGERHFFNLQMLDDENQAYEYKAASMESTLPDIRNLLCWEPRIEFSEEGIFKVSFSTPDSPGQYTVTLSGMDPVNRTRMLRKAMFFVK